MAFPVIHWRNILRNSGALITASSTASGFAATNVKDFRSFTLWKSNSVASPSYIDIDLGASGSVDADAIGVVNHNMVAEVGQIKIYADTVFPPTNVAQASYTPTSDAVDFKTFTGPGAKRYWRVEFNKGAPFTNAPFCGVIFLGLKMTMPEYLAPDVDPFMHDIEVMTNRTAGGHAAGAILRGIQRRGTMNFGGPAGIVRTFLASDLNAFLTGRYKRCEPWVFQLDSADSDFSPAHYLKKPDGATAPRMPVGGVYARMTVPIAYEEAYMEAAP